MYMDVLNESEFSLLFFFKYGKMFAQTSIFLWEGFV